MAKNFTVIAGRYEQGYSDDENIQFASAPCNWEEAFALAKKHTSMVPGRFCFIEYDGQRLQFY